MKYKIYNILKRNDYVFYGDQESRYKFKERLMYKANVLNKRVFNVNEMYTTMTCSSCGHLNDVRKKEIYKCESISIRCNKTLLRDVSAAKNILMKGIMRFL